MPLQRSLARVQQDIEDGDLGKARDRLHGLLSSYPDDLSIRKRLGDIYWHLQLPEMAGRYWYLEERKDGKVMNACQRFEAQFNNDPAHILFAIKFKGQLEPIQGTFAWKKLQELHQQAREKHSWYVNYQNKGALKFRQYIPSEHKTRDAIIKAIIVGFLLLLFFILVVGVISIIKWFI